MKYSEITEKYIFTIDNIIDLVEGFISDRLESSYYEVNQLTFYLQNSINILRKINYPDIDKEFVTAIENPEKLEPLIHIYKVRFEKLLNWDYTERYYSEDNINRFFDYYHKHNNNLTSVQDAKIAALYISLLDNLLITKEEVIQLFIKWNKMAKPIGMESGVSKYRIAKNKKTDIVKIVSAMYDARLFVTADGFIASNKQEVMNEFGRLLGEDFGSYSTILSQSKNTELNSFLKPFKDLEKRAKEYFEKEKE